jgi:U3 small nucleolar RNA-associated protein 5
MLLVIRATIQRLASLLTGILLQKLTERLHKRPGRAGNLILWAQWTLVTHGGYLATQPDLID